MRPLLLDFYCCAGGATRGYQNAGFYVMGVDIKPQPNYCGDDFIQADVVEFLTEKMDWVRCLADAVHASPPCQRYTTLARGNNANSSKYPDLVDPTRELLVQTGLPYVIENVPTAPLRSPVTLCGEMFGLGVIRHRAFESNVLLTQPEHVPHRGKVRGWRHGVYSDGPYVAVYGEGGGKGSVAEWKTAMGIDWTDVRPEIAEAIPPAYTEFIGRQLIQALEVAA